MNSPRGRAGAYVVALLAVLVATAIRALIHPVLDVQFPLITYFAAVAVAAWYGGLRPGLLAAVASYLIADWLFIPPRWEISLFSGDVSTLTGLIMFMLVTGIIIGLSEALARARQRVETEARRAAEEHNLLEVTLSSIGDAVAATDVEGRVTFLNPIAEELTGWPTAEARGRPLTEVFRIVNEQTGQTVEDPCAKVLRTGKIVGLANHTILIAKDGTRRPIDDSAAPIFDRGGKIFGVVLVFRDATSQRATEEALQKLAAIVEHSEDAVIGKNRDGIITSWNAGAERLYGYTADEMIGKHINTIVPPEQFDDLNEIMRRLHAGERIDHWDTVRIRKDGTPVDVSLRISPIKNSYGEVIGASKVARDITSRKQAETSLHFLVQASTSLGALVDQDQALQQAAELAVPHLADWCMVFSVGENGSLEHKACAHRDPQRQQLLETVLKQYPLEWNSPSMSARVLRTGKPELLEEIPQALIASIAMDERARQAARELDPRSLISVPLLIRSQVVGAMTLVRSVPYGYSPAELPYVEEFARRVSIAVENARLFQSLKESDRQKDEFLAMLAHELRNPVAAIKYAATAAQIPDLSGREELFEMMDRQVANLAHLIDDLLDVSRLSRGKIKLNPTHIDAATVVQRAVGAVRALIEEKNHRLTVDVAPVPMPLFADPTRAEQIIANLLTNAGKYTPPGGQVSVRAYPEDGQAVIKVSDTGVGLPPEMLPRVFDLFTQIDRTLDRSEGGLGIGLTVVRKLAEMHGGNVSAQSEGLGHGSQFTVRLPLSEQHHTSDDQAEPAALAQPGKLRILVVDDNRDTTIASALLLKSRGHEVRQAYDGPSALDVAREFRPDVILLDIGLPGLNGYQVARQLRQEGFTEQMLIAISGYGQPDDRKRSEEAGFNHHLVKPVEHDQLFALLASARAVHPAG